MLSDFYPIGFYHFSNPTGVGEPNKAEKEEKKCTLRLWNTITQIFVEAVGTYVDDSLRNDRIMG